MPPHALAGKWRPAFAQVGFGVAAFARFATKGSADLPSRSWRSKRTLVGATGIEPVTPTMSTQGVDGNYNKNLALRTSNVRLRFGRICNGNR